MRVKNQPRRNPKKSLKPLYYLRRKKPLAQFPKLDLPKRAFLTLLDQIISKNHVDFCLRQDAIQGLRMCSEYFLIQLFSDAKKFAKNNVLMPIDLKSACALRNLNWTVQVL